MLSRGFSVALAAASTLLGSVMAGDTTNTMFLPTVTSRPTGLRALKFTGCFATAVPMINHGPHIYQTSGNCQEVCYYFKNTAMALGNGTDCWCGDFLPPRDAKVDDAKCNTPCAGYGQDKCGSGSEWSVYQTGFTLNDVPFYDAVSSSTSASITSAPTTSAAQQTNAPEEKKSNTVGIVVGVIVGIILLAAIAGGGFLWMRRKQQKNMEEYKKHNDVQSFVDGGKAENVARPNMWAPDSRLDTAAEGRRVSNGSIADNQDYSRKILQVRNPDGF